jgi:beta-N-acetylhexosaminidase
MDQIGSLIITGIKGLVLNDFEKEFLKDKKIGGVVLFNSNFESPSQLAELINSIQTLRDEYPLFIATDHEGGRVQQFKKGFTHFPSMFEISKMNSPKYIFESHKIMAKELFSCGVNLNLSPVCDIWSNTQNAVIGDRAFGTSADQVEKMITAAIRGLQSENVMSCAKHFPGHGLTLKDSNFHLPIIKDSLQDLENRDLIPFLKASKSRVEFMMMSHLIIEELDPNSPASLSVKCYEYLRKFTKFSKIVITDNLEMKSMTDRFSLDEMVESSLSAGADILLFKNSSQAVNAYVVIEKAVKNKSLSKDLIQDKINRINELKKEKLPPYKPIYIPKITDSLNSKEAKHLLQQYKSWQSQSSIKS